MTPNIQELIKFSKTLKVLLVEDNKEARTQAVKLLKNLFVYIDEAEDGLDGLEKFKKDSYDLVITDINMPTMNGIEMGNAIREINIEIPIIVLSAHSDSDIFLKTIDLDISGYILKPIKIQQFIKALNSTVEKLKLRHEVKEQNEKIHNMNKNLSSLVEEKTSELITLNKELEGTYREIISTVGAIGESRSKETANHVKRVAEYSKLLALKYGLTKEESEMLKQASPMHDIGKIGIPDSILNKPGKLTDEEFKEMQNHSALGYDMFKSSSQPLLLLAATIAHEHHEKYNGRGYPNGLVGENISIYGRITAVADVFDALGSDRVYKKAWDDERIFKLFKEEKGEHFDPNLIDIFFDNLDEFLHIRGQFA